jgi:hypothetical protein
MRNTDGFFAPGVPSHPYNQIWLQTTQDLGETYGLLCWLPRAVSGPPARLSFNLPNIEPSVLQCFDDTLQGNAQATSLLVGFRIAKEKSHAWPLMPLCSV